MAVTAVAVAPASMASRLPTFIFLESLMYLVTRSQMLLKKILVKLYLSMEGQRPYRAWAAVFALLLAVIAVTTTGSQVMFHLENSLV